jgi:hypothetical protein
VKDISEKLAPIFTEISREHNWQSKTKNNVGKIKIAKHKVGDTIQFGHINGEPLVWRIAEQNHKGFPEDTVTIITDRTIGSITFAPANPLDKNHDRRLYGTNRYKDSYVRRFINSLEFTNLVFDPEELHMIIDTKIKTRRPDVDGGGIDATFDRLFLLSASEAGHEEDDDEGSVLELFKDGKNRLALGIDGDPDWWWLRSALAEDSCIVHIVYTDGSVPSDLAYDGPLGVRPACNLKASYEIKKEMEK